MGLMAFNLRRILLLLVVLLTGCPQAPPKQTSAAIEALSQPAAQGFARADKPRQFAFPADDGPHPDFQTEWWYYTGNLETDAQRHFGYELTIFRRGLKPGADKADDWATHQIYFAHLTVTDAEGQKFYPFERFGRQSIGLAGAQSKPFKVWIDNWSISGDPDKATVISAADSDIELKLKLQSLKPPVLQGDKGLSHKSENNASYYYSRTRMKTAGSLTIGGQNFSVSGLSWMDREWSTSALSTRQSGWDWFSLQFDDGRELMLYQLRLKAGGVDTFSAGTLIAADGSSRHLTARDFRISPQGTWTSPHTRIRYPSGWQVEVPSAALKLTISPWQADQELPGDLRYWEGAARVTGSATGNGYVELTGY